MKRLAGKITSTWKTGYRKLDKRVILLIESPDSFQRYFNVTRKVQRPSCYSERDIPRSSIQWWGKREKDERPPENRRKKRYYGFTLISRIVRYSSDIRANRYPNVTRSVRVSLFCQGFVSEEKDGYIVRGRDSSTRWNLTEFSQALSN